ncbi:MAG: hypothetical protein M3324_08230, partial [Actinomycetota bacterium]|nr:hypothetical protein [Actinomycetota bacterium]
MNRALRGEVVPGKVLTVLLVLSVLYGCNQASSPVEKQERRGGVEQAAGGEAEPGEEQRTREVAGNEAAIVGEGVRTPSFDFRFLDYFVTDHYYYLENPSKDEVMEGSSLAGEFVVVTYSLTNTSGRTLRPDLDARLRAGAGGKTGVYEESGDVMHPRSGPGTLELAPGQMGTGQFIFDVPAGAD